MSSGGAFLETYLEKMEQPEKQVAALIRDAITAAILKPVYCWTRSVPR